MKTYYALLGLESDASQDEIEAAYQRQRQRYAVEQVADMDEEIYRVAQQRTAELDQAYHTLADPQRRQEYDARIGSTAAQPARPTNKKLTTRELSYAAGGVVVALLLIGAIWTLTGREEMPSVGEVNRPAPEFVLPALDGSTVQLSDYRGNVILVNFWGTWCEPCKRETPALQAAYEQLRDQGLVIIGVNLTDDELVQGNTEADIQAFVDQYNVTYPIALDMEGDVLQSFRVYPLPTSFFVDPEGNIRYVRVGEITTEEVVALFNTLQQESAAQQIRER